MAHYSQHVIAARIHACKKAFPGGNLRDSDVSVGHGPYTSATVICEGESYDVGFGHHRTGGILATDVILSKYVY